MSFVSSISPEEGEKKNEKERKKDRVVSPECYPEHMTHDGFSPYRIARCTVQVLIVAVSTSARGSRLRPAALPGQSPAVGPEETSQNLPSDNNRCTGAIQ
ncbi:hypothetical protein X777_14660 [Ooceraea biroi]|uniref:Uncharacterized protein n=1 Tax=Ooceraea biroi TaxID=2015173 RepID=A0A026VWR1_OOCBI|nr:hypothetical protein X777_14660 [Ooceraea biroi]